ncbi:GntR family transcriptional regulator, partial [Rhodococcus sp. TAF43]|uniref:GntR family transcriptional regulator n=1 Tax=Rhodococcus sp. TAF43 TaxID=3237483 RepID=UPI003F9C5DAF
IGVVGLDCVSSIQLAKVGEIFVFIVDRRSGTPTYLQLVVQTKRALLLGELREGDRLPTAKDVVEALGINPNTVLKAYRELEREGLVEARPGRGTRIINTIAKPGMACKDSLLAQLRAWIESGREAGLDREDFEALFSSALDAETSLAPRMAVTSTGAQLQSPHALVAPELHR